jgi:hypothetical protein
MGVSFNLNSPIHAAKETVTEAAKAGYGKVKSGAQSDTFKKVSIGLAGALIAAGLLAAAIGGAALLQHANRLPDFMDKVGVISEKAAYAMIAAGAASVALGFIAIRYAKKRLDASREAAEKQFEKDTLRAESLSRLPAEYQEKARGLQPGQYRMWDERSALGKWLYSKTYKVVVRLDTCYQAFEGVSKFSDLKRAFPTTVKFTKVD